MSSIRTFRIIGILKRGGKKFHSIYNTFLITVSQLSNIGSLLLLIIYMYSVLGMMLFGSNVMNGLMNY